MVWASVHFNGTLFTALNQVAVVHLKISMMTSSNGKISALLAMYAGNSPITGEFPEQRPVTGSFDVLFDLRPNKRLSKQSWGWWFEMPSHPLWRHCNFPPILKPFAVSWQEWEDTRMLTATMTTRPCPFFYLTSKLCDGLWKVTFI